MKKFTIAALFLSTGLLAGGVRQPLPPGEGSRTQEVKEKKKSPFTEPQKRSKRIRQNPGSWNPIVDLTDVFPGNRAMNRKGVFELYDAAIGVKLRVEQARRSERQRNNFSVISGPVVGQDPPCLAVRVQKGTGP